MITNTRFDCVMEMSEPILEFREHWPRNRKPTRPFSICTKRSRFSLITLPRVTTSVFCSPAKARSRMRLRHGGKPYRLMATMQTRTTTSPGFCPPRQIPRCAMADRRSNLRGGQSKLVVRIRSFCERWRRPKRKTANSTKPLRLVSVANNWRRRMAMAGWRKVCADAWNCFGAANHCDRLRFPIRPISCGSRT